MESFFGLPTEEHTRNLTNPEGSWDIPIHSPTRPPNYWRNPLSMDLLALLADGVSGRLKGYYPGRLTDDIQDK
jgi:hypothetical protein